MLYAPSFIAAVSEWAVSLVHRTHNLLRRVEAVESVRRLLVEEPSGCEEQLEGEMRGEVQALVEAAHLLNRLLFDPPKAVGMPRDAWRQVVRSMDRYSAGLLRHGAQTYANAHDVATDVALRLTLASSRLRTDEPAPNHVEWASSFLSRGHFKSDLTESEVASRIRLEAAAAIREAELRQTAHDPDAVATLAGVAPHAGGNGHPAPTLFASGSEAEGEWSRPHPFVAIAKAINLDPRAAKDLLAPTGLIQKTKKKWIVRLDTLSNNAWRKALQRLDRDGD